MNPFESTSENDPTVQGSKAWLAAKLKRIGGSEVSIVLGINPWRTRYDLWCEKTELSEPPDLSNNYAVQRGTQYEPIARKKLEDLLGTSFIPKVHQHSEYSFVGASTDGENEDYVIEIKCGGAALHQATVLKEPPPSYYEVQTQWNMLLAGKKKCLFVSYHIDSDDLAYVEVLADEPRQQGLLKTVQEFWKLVESKTPPELVDADYRSIVGEPFKEAVKAYKDAQEASKRAERDLDVAKEQLLSHVAKTGSFKGEGVTITRFFSKGSIEYGKIEALKGIDLEPYRKSPVAKTLITLEKKK
jgi:putative phage-type endonuclease